MAKVTIKKEDVELIVSYAAKDPLMHGLHQDSVLKRAPVVTLQMSEMEISRAVAERSLREHMGNVVEALVALTN